MSKIFKDHEHRAAINDAMSARNGPAKVVGMGAPIHNAFRLETENAFKNGKLATLPSSTAKPRNVAEPRQPRQFLTTPQMPIGMTPASHRIFEREFTFGNSTRGQKGRIFYTDDHHEQIFNGLGPAPQHDFTKKHVDGFQQAISDDISRQGADTRVNTRSATSKLTY